MGKLAAFSDEIGWKTLVHSSRDIHLIILVRMLRLMAFGFTTLILVVFLKETGMEHATIGYFMTMTFLGDLVSSFVFSVMADGLGRRFTMVISCVIMGLTGVAFAMFTSPIVLIAAAIVGIITPGGGEVGPFRSIEQSSLATLAPHEARSDVYAWYTFLGFFCSALGSVLCGAWLDYLTVKGYTDLAGYKLIFWGYALISVISIGLCLLLSNKMELERKEATPEAEDTVEDQNVQAETDESTALLDQPKKPKSKFFPGLNADILAIVIKLSILFGLDAFASSLVQGTWLSYYIKNKFEVSSTTLGSIFFITNNIAGFCSLFSTSLTKRLGPVVTMVVTHLPASTLLILLPLPNSLYVTLAILFVRALTQSMDVAPKHVFLATLVPPEFRTTVFAWTNIVKTMGLTFGPSITGYLTGISLQWLAFVIGGSLKVTYDIGILATFLSYNRHQEH
ncbi:CIC11C00000001014 [Sungouiella intermedia]|uniref:CIC11C00000001014 n=1 Tax=Sungouiella intermedia TaxID=45354 RepID=A0A1L0BUF7_9ASCO|nr:CIC11C00000001014 [[Candida] intermedia]